MGTYSVESTLVHARAQHCSPLVVDRGQQVVQFEGTSYVMMGIYFARWQGLSPNQNGDRELYYILRPVSRNGEGEAIG